MNTKILLAILGVLLVIGIGALFVPGSPSITFTKDQAIDAVIAQHPELAAYKTTSLPPSSIETKPQIDGWSVAFVQRGSGVPGILQAQCYYVSVDGTVAATGQYTRHDNIEADTVAIEDCTPDNVPSPQVTVLPYGNVTLKIGDTAQFKDISIKPISIEEDSRCPVDVQCIWAGTVRVKIQVVSGTGTSTSIVTLDQPFTTEAQRITLTAVTPEKHSQTQASTGGYRLSFNVVPQTASAGSSAKCYVGGCSSQLCTDQPDAVSTCIYNASYACYKTAACERQTNGECGWTQTPQLAACLANS
jgi:hypothetical protein